MKIVINVLKILLSIDILKEVALVVQSITNGAILKMMRLY